MASDVELCKCLVEDRNDEDMETACGQLESDHCTGSSHNCNTDDVSIGAVNTDIESVMGCFSISGDENVLSVAVHKLEAVACQNGFTIDDVPCGGNCMFSAVS